MKKLLSTLVVVFLLISMVACGGTNAKLGEAIDAFNAISDQFNEIAATANANIDALDGETVDLLNELADALNQNADLLENGEGLTDEQLDAVIAWAGTAKLDLTAIKTALDVVIAVESEVADVEEVEETEAVEVTEETEGIAFPEALNNVEAYEVPDVTDTAWQLAGGVIDGVEMEQEALDAVLEACGGFFAFAFGEEGVAAMYNGETEYVGTCETVADNYAIYMEFEGYSYYGVFTAVEENVVLIVANPEAPETAFYMVQIAE